MLIEKFEGGPVGIDSIAAALSEERGTLEDVLEPYLIQQGYLVQHAAGPHGDSRRPTGILACKAPAGLERPQSLTLWISGQLTTAMRIER